MARPTRRPRTNPGSVVDIWRCTISFGELPRRERLCRNRTVRTSLHGCESNATQLHAAAPRQKPSVVHDTHGQFTKLPRYTPAELSRMKADKEARDAHELFIRSRKNDEVSRQHAIRESTRAVGPNAVCAASSAMCTSHPHLSPFDSLRKLLRCSHKGRLRTVYPELRMASLNLRLHSKCVLNLKLGSHSLSSRGWPLTLQALGCHRHI